MGSRNGNNTTTLIRGRDAAQMGTSRASIARMVRSNELERVARGIYVKAGADVSENHVLAIVATRFPRAVVCLFSALRFHQLGTQSAANVWLAMPQGTSRRTSDWPPVTFVHLSSPAFHRGIETHVIEGAHVRIYSKEKTVADCFKFRHKIGLEVALEALREYMRLPTRSVDVLWREARAVRVANVIRPYLEALS